ncbi:MAG TPA: hypothetical protein PLD25_31050 [Chloroflexota bacterium]|nr:hypothetical protein [Chloroflexota bacterium]HUM70465.1 hypothetical protein [Chloroflexota bacterium]
MAGIQAETGEKPRLIELPVRGPETRWRALSRLIIGPRGGRASLPTSGRRWLVGERPYSPIFMDNAERLYPEALLGCCTNLQTVTGTFILAVQSAVKRRKRPRLRARRADVCRNMKMTRRRWSEPENALTMMLRPAQHKLCSAAR